MAPRETTRLIGWAVWRPARRCAVGREVCRTRVKALPQTGPAQGLVATRKSFSWIGWMHKLIITIITRPVLCSMDAMACSSSHISCTPATE
uniref:Uncharacterized protein n=1 Tax=Anopheles atroparvus TaxID=41427 RepID=A0AAG5DQQ5_ANOAO